MLVIVFFGIIPVTMTYYLALPEGIQTVNWQCFLASIACGLVIDTLLIINNYRDIDNDRRTGKRTLIVAVGAKWGRILYFAMGLLACLMGNMYHFSGHFWAVWLPIIIYLPLHIATFIEMRRINKGAALNRILGLTARNIFIYGLTISIGLIL